MKYPRSRKQLTPLQLQAFQLQERVEVELHATCYGAAKLLSDMPSLTTAEAVIELLVKATARVNEVRQYWDKRLAKEGSQNDRKKV